VAVHDPAVRQLPSTLLGVTQSATPIDAARGADAVVVATEWPDYRQLSADDVIAAVKTPLIVDPNRFLGSTLGADPRVRLVSVGQS
jgi:UDPglucose 6-dehydrogenase